MKCTAVELKVLVIPVSCSQSLIQSKAYPFKTGKQKQSTSVNIDNKIDCLETVLMRDYADWSKCQEHVLAVLLLANVCVFGIPDS